MIRIYVANLEAYNEGMMKGAWFTLPTPIEEVYQQVFDSSELDENGQPYGDFAIHDYEHDYESEFEINEYENIDILNEVAELFETLSNQDIEIILSLYNDGILSDLREGKEALEKVIRYPNCKDMGDIAYVEVQERYGNEEEYEFFLRNFNYDSYGEELESTGTYLFLNDMAIQYLN